jgi:hypothetical protein
MAWNLENYEDVATLNKWFQDNFPMGSIRVYHEHLDTIKAEVVFRCELYRDVNDSHPAVVNWARGKAEEYPRNMARWYIEDTATSVIGRSILLLKAADKTATKESMEQVKQTEEKVKFVKPIQPIEVPEGKPVPNEPETVIWDEVEVKAVDPQPAFLQTIQESLNAEVIEKRCAHGSMIRKEGVSKAGKPYCGYVCGAASKKDQCEPSWGKQVGGKWVFEDKAVNYG